MSREKTGEIKNSRVKNEEYGGSGLNETSNEYRDFLQEYLRELTIPREQSEGFIYFPSENIAIIPGKTSETNGVIEIREPEKLIGTEVFQTRDAFEKDFPAPKLASSVQYENQVFNGEKCPDTFSPEFGGRFCLTAIPIYETKDNTYVSVPILPDTGQRYGRHAKLGCASLLRGTQFPVSRGPNQLLTSAMSREMLSGVGGEQGKPPWTRPGVAPTGLWTIRFYDKAGHGKRYSEIRDCHVERDPETGTFELFLIRKQFVFGDINDVDIMENFPIERARALVSLSNLKNTEEGLPLKLDRLCMGNQRVEDISGMPQNYRQLFEERDGQFFLKELRAVPPLRSFLRLEQKVINRVPDTIKNDTAQEIGELFEDLVERTLNAPKNTKYFPISIPSGTELEDLIEGQSDDFKEWARKKAGKEVEVRPDFVLEDGTFVEVKTGKKIAVKPKKKDQMNRMILYKLVTKGEFNIRVFSLEEETQEKDISSPIPVEVFSDTEFGQKIKPEDLNLIHIWKRKLNGRQQK